MPENNNLYCVTVTIDCKDTGEEHSFFYFKEAEKIQPVIDEVREQLDLGSPFIEDPPDGWQDEWTE